jgi:hypothetical protein
MNQVDRLKAEGLRLKSVRGFPALVFSLSTWRGKKSVYNEVSEKYTA